MTTREYSGGSWLDRGAISVPGTHRGFPPRRISLSARAAQRRAESWGDWAQRHSKTSAPTGSVARAFGP